MPASPRPQVSRRHGRRRLRRGAAAAGTVLAALLAGGYTAAVVLTPAPAPALEASGDARRTFQADPAPAQAAVDAQTLPTAAGWLDGEEVWVNAGAPGAEDPQPIASITKLVTALVTLEQQPLAPGSEGATHLWSEADLARSAAFLAEDGVAFPIPAGTAVTARQMLTLALIPSANDFAAAYALSVFGDDARFAAAAADWAERHGLGSLTVVEPTGMDERNVASAADVLRIARLALRDPVIAEIVRQPSAELPWGIGVVESTNPLFGVLPGVRGVKTGRTSAAGYNLVAAQAADAGGREAVQLAVTLGRPSEESRLASSLDVLGALRTAPRRVSLVTEGERLGTAVTADGARVPLIAAEAASAVLLPGEAAERVAELAPPQPGTAGAAAGVLRLDSPAGRQTVRIVTAEPLAEPDLWWRLTHPGGAFDLP
ncbi:D-alanyl-D-alanine carboxypeptidase family protein [Leucobacter massiliensis]|uniref:D-alanyl-D-alanine carboxypeptidase family protein n=1 Tax=Leucobacter massiliensis TaxID=1686285 RepID=UPI0015E3DCA1|nr:D-alanyl-D-alanine carboxypeptidase [Leucobacter massiliensis]